MPGQVPRAVALWFPVAYCSDPYVRCAVYRVGVYYSASETKETRTFCLFSTLQLHCDRRRAATCAAAGPWAH
eukprot:6217410-Prymnesium_polylepis.1